MSVIPVLIDPSLAPAQLRCYLCPCSCSLLNYLNIIKTSPERNPSIFIIPLSIVQCGFSTNTFIVYWRCCQACDELIIPILMHATFSTEGVSEEGGGWGEERINTSKYVSSCHQQPTGSNLAADWLIRRLYEYPSRSVLHYTIVSKKSWGASGAGDVRSLHCIVFSSREGN